jgi:ChrB-like protein
VREWVLLSYRLPREPSTPRIALWRRLRRLGALQLGDGLAGLPLDDDALEQCNWLATEVEEAGGEATVWTAQPSSKAEADALRQRLVETAAADYRAIVEASEAASGRRAALRLQRALRAVQARDRVSPPERADAERAVEDLLEAAVR